ncbi:MAG: translational GTPase TypA [Burkholderiaceae bacterium]
MSTEHIRNLAIIAHVDHGKTTLVDQLLRQSGTFRENQQVADRVMDNNDLERERGITILAKNCAVQYDGTRINIVDTPGHADFGGEVERALSMVDGVLLLVDAVDGPMPQTRFVTRKALALGLKPIVVINKVDRPGARPDWVLGETFDLFYNLGADESQLDFVSVLASALHGWAVPDVGSLPSAPVNSEADAKAAGLTMNPLFDTILEHVPARRDDVEGPLQMQISALDYSSYVGRIGIGRINRGTVRTNAQIVVAVPGEDGEPITKQAKVGQVLRFAGLDRTTVESAGAGDIVAITGVEAIDIGSTLCDPLNPEPLPMLHVDEPTMTMEFLVNTSPMAGREGKYVTSRQLRERLERELKANVALRVEFTSDSDTFIVSGRGELHLTILLENMRREGYEMAVSRPKPKIIEKDGERLEPFEALTMDVEQDHQGPVMELLGRRRGELTNMVPDSADRVRLDYRIPARGLIGFHHEFLNLTRGSGIMSHVFDDYAPWAGEIEGRRNGVLISQDDGNSVAYALWKLQERGRMFVTPGEPLYEGMIIGLHTRDNDLVVNPVREKKLTNVRSAGKDDAILLTPPMELTLERAVEFIADDELVEITPTSIRLRKRWLKEHERRRFAREAQPA